MTGPLPASNFHYLLHPYNTSLVTCCDAEGQPNVIAIAWLIPVSVQPPLVGMSIRPTRHSYGLIQATDEFVVNVAPYEIAQQVLFCGRRSGRDVDKFAATGLTPGQAQHVRPPIIEECIAHLECRVMRDIPAGDHRFVIAEVLAAYARPGILDDHSLYDLGLVHPLLHLGRNRFTSTRPESIEPSLEMTSLVAILLGQAPTTAKAAHITERYCACPYCVSLAAEGDAIIGLFAIPSDHRWWLEWVVDRPQETLGLKRAELFFAQQIEAASPWSRGKVKAEQDRAPCGADCLECPSYQQKCEGCPATRHYTCRQQA